MSAPTKPDVDDPEIALHDGHNPERCLTARLCAALRAAEAKIADCEAEHPPEPWAAELEAENKRLRKALQEIAGIPKYMTGPDWCEIEEAHRIARAALSTEESR